MTSERLGQKVHIRDAGGSGLVSSRFLVRTSGGDADHHTAGFAGDDNHPIKWDDLAEWDDIGFDVGDYASSGQFFFADAGDYLITASAELAADAAFTTGQVLLAIETNVSVVNTEATTLIQTGADPELSVATVHRFVGGLVVSFEVHLLTFNVDDSGTIAKAAVTITKLN